MKKPNVPMNHAITTCRHKVDKKKFEEGWDRIWGKKTEEDLKEERLRQREKEWRKEITKHNKLVPDDEIITEDELRFIQKRLRDLQEKEDKSWDNIKGLTTIRNK